MLKTLLLVVCLFQAGLACDDDEQASSRVGDYSDDPYGVESVDVSDNPFMNYLYGLQQRAQQQAFAGAGYEGRAKRPSAARPQYGYDPSQSRFLQFPNLNSPFISQVSTSLNNAIPNLANKPNINLGSLLSGRPPLFSLNPNLPNLLTTFDSCTAPTGESGICTPGKVCSLSGGRPSGSCILGGVCCINVVSACGGTVTLNNTYWQSPNPSSTAPGSSTSNSICSVNVKLDTGFVEQKKPICQLRLDFVTFSIAQPNAETVCNVDTFQAGGSLDTNIPTICGDNPGQHMYLNVPNSGVTPSSLQLFFTFGSSSVARSWSIKIAMLPCGADYLAPAGCLQYFTSSTGTVSSFNWRDVAGTATRQLANQNYDVCFRNELVNNQGAASAKASTICYTPCTTTTTAKAFSVSQATNVAGNAVAPGTSQGLVTNCNNDFVLIPGGFDPAVAITTPTNALDRFCGERLNPLFANAASTTVCSTVKPFQFVYRTNGDETVTPTVDNPAGGVGNMGFCFSFSQRA